MVWPINLSGPRDGAIASFRLKNVDLDARTVFHDGRDVKTKARKTFKLVFFPVGPEPKEIFASYVRMRKKTSLPPGRPAVSLNGLRQGRRRVSTPRGSWTCGATAEPIRRIFRDAFTAVGLPAFNPHSFRARRWCGLASRFAGRPKNGRHGAKNWSRKRSYDIRGLRRGARASAGRNHGQPRQAQRHGLAVGIDLEALTAFLMSADRSGRFGSSNFAIVNLAPLSLTLLNLKFPRLLTAWRATRNFPQSRAQAFP